MTELCEQRSSDRTISFATLMTDFPVKWMASAFVPFIDSNPSFTALNLAEDRAQLSINSSNKPSDTSIMCQTAFFPLFKKFKQQIIFQTTTVGHFVHLSQEKNYISNGLLFIFYFFKKVVIPRLSYMFFLHTSSCEASKHPSAHQWSIESLCFATFLKKKKKPKTFWCARIFSTLSALNSTYSENTESVHLG